MPAPRQIETMTVTLDAAPSPLALYARAAASSQRRPGAITTLPPLSLRLAGIRPDPRRLAAYRKLCGIAETDVLPISFPQVAVTALHMALMTQPKFPLPLLGLVHVSNRITQSAPIPVGAVYDADVRIGDTRVVRAGLEFDLLTDISIDGVSAWQAVTTIIHRRPVAAGGRPRKTVPAESQTQLARYQSFRVAADTGRRYARISGDYNPIHLYAATAKLFGFPRAIAHGMWSLARCLGTLEAEIQGVPTALEVHFKKPLLLPASVTLKSTPDGSGIAFSLLSTRSGALHLSGVLR